MYCVFVVLFSDLYCVFVVVGVVYVIFGAEDRKQERKKTLFYTVRIEQLLLRTRELLFIASVYCLSGEAAVVQFSLFFVTIGFFYTV